MEALSLQPAFRTTRLRPEQLYTRPLNLSIRSSRNSSTLAENFASVAALLGLIAQFIQSLSEEGHQ